MMTNETVVALLKTVAASALVLGSALFYSEKASAETVDLELRSVDHNPGVRHLLDTLKEKGKDPSNTICLRINSPGGAVHLMMEIINEMKRAKATVVTIANGVVYSAAGPIMLAGDKLIFGEHSIFMLHKVRVRSKDGKTTITNDPESAIMNNMISQYYNGLVTKKQYEQFLDNKDVFINGKRIKSLLSKDRLADNNTCS